MAVIVVGAVSQRAAAQAASPAGVVNPPIVADTIPTHTKAGAFAIRSLTGTLGLVGAAAVVVGLAAVTGPHACDDCGGMSVDGALAVIGIGGALFGTPVGASVPKLSSKCTFGTRMLRSTAGSVVGSLLGTAISYNVYHGDAVLVGMPLGAVLGSSTALIGC